ncbi:MAG: multicopper oxidase domain-containing protein [Gaiellaceae bacterium]
MTPLSRRRFLIAAAPVLGATPLLRHLLPEDAARAGNLAGEGHSSHAGRGLEAPGARGENEGLLIPAPAEPARRGRVREVELVAENREIEVANCVRFPAWTYNGSVPGPVVRATEGDLLRIRFRNDGTHPHSIHFHGIHPPRMDGVLDPVAPGESFTYEFEARPYGMQLYHCHTGPLAQHIQRGLYGAFIIDPPEPKPPAQELVMMLSGFDLDGDERNEVYAVNGRAFYYDKYPVVVKRSETVRIYLANLTEYDPVNSFHLHGEFFRLYRTGSTDHHEYTDTVVLGQGERCIIEIDFHHKGLYMFHAHQSKLAERGWMGWFNVVDTDAEAAGAAVALNGYADELARCDPCVNEIDAKALLKY